MNQEFVTGTAVIPPPAIVEADDGFSLRLQRKPEAIVAEARLCAEALVAAVKRNGWARQLGGSEHLFFEAWAFLGAMFRVTPRTVSTQLVQIGDVVGYECTAEAVHIPSGMVVGRADAMVLNDEDNWSTRPIYEYNPRTRRKEHTGERPVPLFQLRSMAQTRAQAKALKGPFSWIIAMAGFAATPAEEMGHGEQPAAQAATAPQQASQQPPEAQQRAPEEQQANDKRVISGRQASRVWALAFSNGVDKKLVPHIVKGFGFDRVEDITTDLYDQVCAAIKAAKTNTVHEEMETAIKASRPQ